MAIPKFYGQYLRRKYPGINRVKLEEFASLLIDMNSFIHRVLQEVYGYGDFEGLVNMWMVSETEKKQRLLILFRERLLQLVNSINPRDALVLAVDGPVPWAKLNQQRSRRYRSSLTPKVFDTNAVTPGTTFMIELDRIIRDWLRDHRSRLPSIVIYSSHLVLGEGEHKIFDYLRNHQIPDTGLHVITGEDADLIMLSLKSPVANNIVLMRQGRDESREFVSIGFLRRQLIADFNSVNAPNDFVVLLFLIGNDFLPRLPSFCGQITEGIEYILSTYHQLRLEGKFDALTEGDGLNYGALRLLFRALALGEKARLESVALEDLRSITLMRGPYTRITDGKTAEINYERFSEAWYENEFRSRGQPNLIVPIDKQGMVDQFISGLSWIYQYYTLGQTEINPEYFYAYFYPPLLRELAEMEWNVSEFRFRGQLWPNVVQQLLLVLPPSSHALLPEETRSWVASELADLYPTTFIVEHGTNPDGKNDEHSTTILPPLEFDRVAKVVSQIDWSPDTYAKLQPQEDWVDLLPMGTTKTIGAGRGAARAPSADRGRGRGKLPLHGVHVKQWGLDRTVLR